MILGIVGAVAATYGVVSAVLWGSKIWYSFFVVGSFALFDLLDSRCNGFSNIGLLIEGSWKPIVYTYALFFLMSIVIDLVLGRYIANMWVYPSYGPIDEAVHVVGIGYPFAFFSVAAFYHAFHGWMSRLPRFANQTLSGRTLLKDGIAGVLYFCLIAGIAVPVLNFFLNANRHVHELMVICWGACAFSVGPVTYFAFPRSFLLDFLSLRPPVVLAALATILVTGPLHEIPNTFAWEWIYQNMPFTNLELFDVHILVLTVGWTFLALFGITGNDLMLQWKYWNRKVQ